MTLCCWKHIKQWRARRIVSWDNDVATMYEMRYEFPASRGSFPGVADGRKETSAMGRKWLWFNRRPRSWTALFETHDPCVVCCPQLEPAASRAFVFINSAVIWAHIVNMTISSARSKECSRRVTEFASFRFGEPSRRKDKKNQSRAV